MAFGGWLRYSIGGSNTWGINYIVLKITKIVVLLVYS